MHALTLYEPHASLMALGAKTIETRAMSTSHRGWLAIHAAKESPKEYRDMALVDPFRRTLEALVPGYDGFDSLPTGAIVGVCWLASVTDVDRAFHGMVLRRDKVALPGEQADYDDVPLHETWFGDYSAGRKAWWCTLLYPLPEPIECRGMPGMWDTEVLHQPAGLRIQVDPTHLAVRTQILATHGVDIFKHALDDVALWRLVNRRGTLGHAPAVVSVAAPAQTDDGVSGDKEGSGGV